MTKRKALRIGIIVLRLILLVFGLTGIASLVYLVISSFINGFDSQKNYWLMMYYSFAILGAIGTVLAVIVALEKEKFYQVLYAPDFEVLLPTISPKVERSNSSESVQKYSQSISIKNIGVADAQGCKIELIRIRFDKNKHGKFKDISPMEQSTITCGVQGGLITSKSSFDMLLFEVENPGAVSIPNAQNVMTASIKFNGITLLPKHASMGQYKLDYRISCNEGVSKSFTVEVEWGGEWSEDVQEMIEKFETKIK